MHRFLRLLINFSSRLFLNTSFRVLRRCVPDSLGGKNKTVFVSEFGFKVLKKTNIYSVWILVC